MPITISDFQTIATRGDIAELLQTVKYLLRETQEGLRAEFQTALNGRSPRPSFLTPRQFAIALAEKPGGRRVTHATICNWCRRGWLKATQEQGEGTHWLIPFGELDRIYSNADRIDPTRAIQA